jgi:hypothetical protein
MFQHFEILLGGVNNSQGIRFKETTQAMSVDGQWINEGDSVAPGNLNQGELWIVRFFAMELGVYGISINRHQLIQHFFQSVVIIDPLSYG